MHSRFLGIVILLALLVLAFGTVGQAVAGGSTDRVIKDASDGTIDGNWSAAQIRAALAYLQNNPVSLQYSDTDGVLEDYLSSLQAPGAAGGGQLAFTGGEIWLIFAMGAGLVGAGLLIRRRVRA
jgi:hypothetical protein